MTTNDAPPAPAPHALTAFPQFVATTLGGYVNLDRVDVLEAHTEADSTAVYYCFSWQGTVHVHIATILAADVQRRR
jgi:hypothetical protein